MPTARNPFEKAFGKEEKLYSMELSTDITKYLRSKKVQSKLDKLLKTTNSAQNISLKSPQAKKAIVLYQKEATAVLKSSERKYPGMILNAKIDLGKEGKSIYPTAKAQATYMRYVAGGFKHQVKNGETFRSLSKKYYGTELYWSVIEDANQVCWNEGHKASIPILECLVTYDCTKAKCKSGGVAKPARILYPEFKIDFSKDIKETHSLHPIRGTPFTVSLLCKCTGSVNIAKPGTLDAVKFNPKSYSASASKALKGTKFKVTCKKKAGSGLATVSISGLGTSWAPLTLALVEGNALKASITPAKVDTKIAQYAVKGTLGFSVTARLLVDGKGLSAKDVLDLWTAQNLLIPVILLYFASAPVRAFVPVAGAAGGVVNVPSSDTLGYDNGYIA